MDGEVLSIDTVLQMAALEKEKKKLKETFDDVQTELEEKDKEISRLNNIIDGYENMKKELLDYIYHNEYRRFGHIDGGEADEMREIINKTNKMEEGK